MIGLTGAAGSGKSTLARAFADARQIPFIATQGSAVYAKCGMDPRQRYSIEESLTVQEVMLHTFEQDFINCINDSGHPMFASDRTPIDLAAYLLADIPRDALVGRPKIGAYVENYVRRCIEMTNRFFSIIVLVQPAIPVVDAEGKARGCRAFDTHYNALAHGLLCDERLGCRHFSMARAITDLQDRLMGLENAIGGAMAHHMDIVSKATKHGLQVH